MNDITISNISIDDKTTVAIQIRQGRNGLEASILHGIAGVKIEIIRKNLRKKVKKKEYSL